MEDRFLGEVRSARLRAALVCVGFVAALATLVWLLTACTALDSTPLRRPSTPLDAIRYEAPSWAQGDVLEVVDRDSGSSWWVIKVDGETIVLPVTVRDMDMTQIGG